MRFKLEDMVRQIKARLCRSCSHNLSRLRLDIMTVSLQSHAFSTPDAVLRRYIEIGKQVCAVYYLLRFVWLLEACCEASELDHLS